MKELDEDTIRALNGYFKGLKQEVKSIKYIDDIVEIEHEQKLLEATRTYLSKFKKEEYSLLPVSQKQIGLILHPVN